MEDHGSDAQHTRLETREVPMRRRPSGSFVVVGVGAIALTATAVDIAPALGAKDRRRSV
jgi:threonine dehydrogenase-like Zn-dependent dehydrogenase